MIKKVIYAPNVHQGGGRALLLPVLEVLKQDADVLFVLDVRLVLPAHWPDLKHVLRVPASVWGRLKAEWQLRSRFHAKMHVLCMASLPPLWAVTAHMCLFIQNRYLLETAHINLLPWKARLRLKLEAMWLRSRLPCIQHIIVQTPSMQRLVQKNLQRTADVFPFADLAITSQSTNETHYDFLYVASGEAHKNHRTLIEAWILLAQQQQFPHLCLTLCPHLFPDLVAWIKTQTQQHALQIQCLGELSQEDVARLYTQSKALIYPSLFESFGLPLLEAVSHGLPVLASDLAYVHDVIQPSQVFDPQSARAIAKAVQGGQTQAAKFALPIAKANTFLKHVFEPQT